MTKTKIPFPQKGFSSERILKLLKERKKDDINWEEGNIWGLVYHAGEKHTKLLKKAYNMFFSKNALSPLAFPSLKEFETEVISMVADLLNGDKKTCGSMTSGGTESILMAIKAYRDWARDKFPDIDQPEMVLPTSAHPSFSKGAQYFGLKEIRVPINEETHRADIQAMKNSITKNTIMLVGSACDFPRGMVDPIKNLGEIALDHNIALHVDSCLGGFILPFLKKLGYHIPDFDFSVPGVTSISADIHKYGYGPKGASCILYRKEEFWKNQFSIFTDWSGGVYVSTTMRGTRPGGSIAASWATLKGLGEDGYLKLTKKVIETSKRIIKGIKEIPELYILGDPHMSVFSFTSDDLDVFLLADYLADKDWHLSRIQFPAALHMIVNPHHAEIVETFLANLKEAVKKVKGNSKKPKEGQAAMYGMVASLPDRKKVKKFITRFIQDQYKL